MKYAAAPLLMAFMLSACVDKSITKMPTFGNLDVKQIVAMLQSKDFKQKLAAQRQISKLPIPTRVNVLALLVKSDSMATRLLAVRLLSKAPSARTTELLKKLTGDSNPIVRAFASKALKK